MLCRPTVIRSMAWVTFKITVYTSSITITTSSVRNNSHGCRLEPRPISVQPTRHRVRNPIRSPIPNLPIKVAFPSRVHTVPETQSFRISEPEMDRIPPKQGRDQTESRFCERAGESSGGFSTGQKVATILSEAMPGPGSSICGIQCENTLSVCLQASIPLWGEVQQYQ